MNELTKLKKDILACNKCDLNKLRGFGYGNIESKIMFLAQNPGMQPADSKIKSEEIIPFALNTEEGKASGSFFRKFLNHFNIKNEDFYITNILKCPREDSNDVPTDEEASNCRDFFEREWELQEPTFVIGLGAAAKKYLKIENYGTVVKRGDINMIAIWHPGYMSKSPDKFDEWLYQFKEFSGLLNVPGPPESKVEHIPEVKVEVIEKTEEPANYAPFTHLHVHDDYSLLDGLSKVEEYAETVAKRGWKHLCITNHGMLGQIPRQHNICKKLGIKPIYGCEVYINNFHQYREYMTKDGLTLELPEGFTDLEGLRKKIKRNYHFILLAKNEVGFKNLMKISSNAWIEGFYRRPRVNNNFILENTEGLIGCSACLAGPLSQLIINDEFEKAKTLALNYKDAFNGDFFIEIMLLDIPDQIKANKGLIQLSEECDIPLVLTNDAHYVNKDDSYFQDMLLMMQNKNTFVDLENREKKKEEHKIKVEELAKKMAEQTEEENENEEELIEPEDDKNIFSFDSKDLWFKTAEELDKTYLEKHTYIPKEAYENAKLNTLKISEKCNVIIDTSLKIPVFKVPEDFEYENEADKSIEYLETLVTIGLEKRGYFDNKKYCDRLKYEMNVIRKMNFADYFLIVNDIVEYARKSDISVGPGRGSAAGSLMCYCLGITDVDPMIHNLFFERFLNEARKDLPDIDIDFSPEGRDNIKEYIIETYGRKHTCSIGTYGSFQTRATILDVCRVMDIPLDVAKRISKSLTSDIDDYNSIKEAMEEKPANEKDNNPWVEKFKELLNPSFCKTLKHGNDEKQIIPLEAIDKIRGKQKNISSHAAGVIISSADLTTDLPLVSKSGTILSAWIEGKKGTELSAFGFIKFDLLGLNNLVFIKDTLKLVNQSRKREIEKRFGKLLDESIIDEDLNDQNVYKELKNGNGSLIFQFESQLMQKLLKDSECDDFNCLAAITALGRPGPLQSKMTEAYCLRKRGEEKYKIHPVLKEVLDYTYGIVVYQEQIMQIVNKLAGFSLAETDLFRKVLIKVKKDTKDGMWDKLQEYKKKFLEGGKKHMSESELLELFDGFLKWAGYGFNKSHAVAYTVISYRCAWLKTYFPLEYICTVLGNVSKGEIKIKGKTTNKYGDYTAEAASLNILFMPIDINKSKVNFATENEKIRQGFTNIKNVGIAPATQIVENQPYTSFTDFVNKNQNISKRVIEPLIKIGAFDELHSNRKKLLIDYYKSKKMKFPKEIERLNKYSDFFSILIKKDLTKLVEDPEHDLKDFTEKEKGLIFREMAGFWIEHPMEKMREKIDENKIEIGRVSEMYQNLYTAAIVYIDEIEEDTPKSKSFKLKISDGNKKLDGTSITINKEYLKSDEKLIVGKKIFLGLMHNVDWGKAEYFRFCKLQFIDDDLKDFEQLSNAYKSMNVLLTKFKKFKEKHKDKVRHESLKDATKYAQIELAPLTVEERATGKVDTKVLVYFLGKVKDTAKQTVLEFGDETSTTLVYAWQNVAETFMQTYKPGAFLQITIESKYLGASNYLFKMLKNDKSLEN